MSIRVLAAVILLPWLIMRTLIGSVMRIWMGGISFASCLLVSRLRHTLYIVLSTTTKSINFFPLRWREVAHVPAARDTHTWMHAGCLTSSCAYQGPGSGSTRETRLALSFQALSLSITLASRLTMQNNSRVPDVHCQNAPGEDN